LLVYRDTLFKSCLMVCTDLHYAGIELKFRIVFSRMKKTGALDWFVAVKFRGDYRG
jgi:hypothetical protein